MAPKKKKVLSLLVMIAGAILAGASWREIAPTVIQAIQTGEI